MKEIPLAGKYGHLVTLVDDEDFEKVKMFSWVFSGRGRTAYARRRFKLDGKHTGEYLHVVLTGWPMVDHVNGDGLDNRRSNLRPASSHENNWNSRKPKSFSGRPCSSAFKGVSRRSISSRPWRAFIKVNYKQVHLGMFADEDDAARAYDAAARLYFGEFAQLNFKEDQ